jgi:hypothetical protein
MRRPALPLEPGKHRGGWNPNPPMPDPNFVPAPGGVPFAPPPPAAFPQRSAVCADIQAAVRKAARPREILPLEPGRHRGGWNPSPRLPDPSFVPAPGGTAAAGPRRVAP